MEDKRAYVFPLFLFLILFVLITVTGLFQVRVIRKSMEGLLRSEGEIFFKQIKREIDINLEYLALLEKAPSLITPSFLNIMVYDEAIVEEMHGLLTGLDHIDPGKLPFTNILVTDAEGTVVARKGNVPVRRGEVKDFLKGKKDTFIRTGGDSRHGLVLGLRLKERAVILGIDEEELDALRKRSVVREIIERQDRGLNIRGITLYDGDGKVYMASDRPNGGTLAFQKPLDSKYLPGFTMTVLVSTDLAESVFRSTSISFVIVLLFLLVAGTLGAFGILLLERRHETRMKRLERKVALQERLVSLGKLASGMAHEIKNPLNAVGISVQRLKREFIPEGGRKDEYERFLDIMRGELQRVNRIVEEFLLSARAQAPFKPEDIGGLLEEVVLVLGERAREKGVEIRHAAGQPIVVSCQKERMKQVFHNLILNAIEATDKGGSVEITTAVRPGLVTIFFRDNGVGIPPDKLDLVFEYYYTTKDKGMGLGLPISYMIVRDHGGEIKVESVQGRGTCFTVNLPAGAPG